MEQKFLNRFCNTQQNISMMELTNTKQWKDKSVLDYINHWHSLSLDYKVRLFEVSVVEICIQRMHWGFLYILKRMWPHTFEELVAWAHDIEFVVKTNASKSIYIEELKDDTIGSKNITNEDEKNATSNFTIIIFKPQHSIMLQQQKKWFFLQVRKTG